MGHSTEKDETINIMIDELAFLSEYWKKFRAKHSVNMVPSGVRAGILILIKEINSQSRGGVFSESLIKNCICSDSELIFAKKYGKKRVIKDFGYVQTQYIVNDYIFVSEHKKII